MQVYWWTRTAYKRHEQIPAALRSIWSSWCWLRPTVVVVVVGWSGLVWSEGWGGGVEVGSPWQMSNFITEPHMNVAHTLPTALHAGIIWSFWETEVLDCNLWAVSFKSHPQLYWRRQLPELVCTFKGYMFRSLSHSLSGTKVKGSLTAWEKVEQCEITLIQRFLPHTSPMNP